MMNNISRKQKKGVVFEDLDLCVQILCYTQVLLQLLVPHSKGVYIEGVHRYVSYSTHTHTHTQIGALTWMVVVVFVTLSLTLLTDRLVQLGAS